MTRETEVEALQRGPVPEGTLAWVAECVGSGAEVVAVEPCVGGTATAVHRVRLRSPDVDLVLKRFVRADWLAREPDLVVREARALDVVKSLAVPTPEVVGVDAAGGRADRPALLMTGLPGRVALPQPPDEGFAARIARPLAVLAAFSLPRGEPLPSHRRFCDPKESDPPSWSSVPELWERAGERLRAPPPPFTSRLVHRDYHPTNLLWRGATLSGVVDWTEACAGPVELDLAHCRHNLVQLYGRGMADAFGEAWRVALERSEAAHPYWDLWSLLDWNAGDEVYPGWARLGFSGLTLDLVRRRIDSHLASVMRCLSELEG